jgi:hypothetical protein
MTALLAGGIVSARAQSTAFTYQGRLRDNNIPAVGVFDLRFALYDASTGGTQVGQFVTADDIEVTNGLFCIMLDFGVNAFSGAERWLETSLRPGTETGDYAVLTPRRALTATPYALYAPNAGTAETARTVSAVNLTGTVPLARLPSEVVINNEAGLTLSGTFSGSGAGLTGVNADLLGDKDGMFYQNAANLTAGTLADARLSANVPLLNANQVFTGRNTFSGLAELTNPLNLVLGIHAGDAASLSNFPAARLTGTAPSAITFTGSLAGDVTGTQASTVVASVGGVTAADLASAASAANSAVSLNTPNTIVKRDDSGNFAAGTITGAFAGDGSAISYLNASQLTTGTVADGRLSANVALLNANQVFTGPNTFSGVARLTNPDNLLVGIHAGDAANLSNFPAVKLTGAAPTAINFTGSLAGDVTGTQGSTLVGRVGGVAAGNIASGANAANGATAAANVNTLVKRDGAGGFAAGTITATFAGPGSGLTGLNASELAGGTVPDERLSASARAGINVANAATSANTPNTIVKRDVSGGFAGNVTGTFSGDGSGLTNIKASSIVGGGGGGTVSLPSGITVVSAVANDPALITVGYRMIMTVPAPSWVNASTANAPSARARHTAIWDGQRLIIWGGKITAGASYASSGAMYHPASDLWDTVSTISAPAARGNHTAVWSGTEMIVWGGDGASAWLNTGARFSPDHQLWRAVSTTGAPTGRSGHVAVWTGTQMLIWGGQNAEGVLDNGALYDPAANQWTTLTLPNPPEARARATAVWADDRVIIWGGEGSAGVLNSGSQLLFANGAPTEWQPLPFPDGTPARRGHTAVWTGHNMIVWGGEAGGAPIGGGAAFDPTANTWAPLLPVGAPVPRFNHAAAWTGQEMLIVGGNTSATELASGSAHDPGSGAWWSLSSAGSPQARAEATASWTGTELLVFGGRAQGQYLSALQRLVPQSVWYFYRKL